jgi:hypothetical protein
MNPHAGSNLRNFEMNKVSSVENVVVLITIGCRQLSSMSVRIAKQGQPLEAEQLCKQVTSRSDIGL